ncbi:MAG TPA: hypothetical protein VNF07_12460 [Acidimicrobiales bacterium]|nr:hypothetical protein [Acidimicrobiales bacterium]
MPDLELAFAIGDNPRSRAILTGAVKPQGINLHASKVHGSEIFWRQLHFQEFEASELSMSSLMIARARGDDTWIGLPVFTSRSFFHLGILVREDAGIAAPADLVGKRVGIPEYQQTAALWKRAVLLHEFGVAPEQMHWFMERQPEMSHGGATGFVAPDGVDFKYVPADSNIGEMLMAGELDCALGYITDNNLVDKSRIQFGPGSGVRRLFPDPVAEARRYYTSSGFFPINHCVAVRRDVAEAHPWVMLNLYSAFLEAKERAREAVVTDLGPFLEAGVVGGEIESQLSSDLFPYGVQANRKILEAMTSYSHEQGLTPRKLSLEEIFYPPSLEL